LKFLFYNISIIYLFPFIKEFQSQQQLGITTGPSSAFPSLSFVGAIGKTSGENQIPKTTPLIPTFSAPSALQTTITTQNSSTLTLTTPIVTTSTTVATTKPAVTAGLTKLSDIGPSVTNEQSKEDSDDEVEFFTEKKTRTTPLPPEEYEKTLTEADFPRRKRSEPFFHDGILTKDDIKEPKWGYKESFRNTVPKLHNISNSEKDLLEQLKIRDKPVFTSKSLTNTTEANKKKVPGSEVPPESNIEARLVYELLLKPRRDGPYAYRGEYDGTWSPLYGDERDRKPKLEPLKWKKQAYYKEYVKDVKRTKFPITEERYEAPSWWDKHVYKPVPKELTKDMDQYDHSQEAFAEDIVTKLGLRPDPPKGKALNVL
jgi:hypothetical protein